MEKAFGYVKYILKYFYCYSIMIISIWTLYHFLPKVTVYMQYIGEDATLSYFLRLGYVLGIGFVFVLMPYFLRLLLFFLDDIQYVISSQIVVLHDLI